MQIKVLFSTFNYNFCRPKRSWCALHFYRQLTAGLKFNDFWEEHNAFLSRTPSRLSSLVVSCCALRAFNSVWFNKKLWKIPTWVRFLYFNPFLFSERISRVYFVFNVFRLSNEYFLLENYPIFQKYCYLLK